MESSCWIIVGAQEEGQGVEHGHGGCYPTCYSPRTRGPTLLDVQAGPESITALLQMIGGFRQVISPFYNVSSIFITYRR